jgi:uncharacterized protein YydD (DUF2326 family)
VRFRRAKDEGTQLEHVRRLARELAERRDSAYADVQAEVASLKAELRERAAAIAERERELTTNGAPGDLAQAQELMRRAEAELKLAEAERARLEEREQRVRAVEKELAALRLELSKKQAPQPQVPMRETTHAGARFALPPAPSFAEGLAALARSRNR